MEQPIIRVKVVGLDSVVDWKRQLPSSDYRLGNIQFIMPFEQNEDFLVVFNSVFQYPIKTKCEKARRIFIASEPPNVHRYNSKFLKQFGTVITADPNCIHQNIIRLPAGLPWHVGRYFDQESKAKLFSELKEWQPKKSKLCSVICSDKVFTKEHQARSEFVEKLKAHFRDKIDFYGRGTNPIEDKEVALAGYRFHIALENTTCSDYWTEKIADPFITLTYPIYGGCDNLEKYFDSKSFTRIDINQPEQAFKIIEQVLNSNIDQENLKYLKDSKERVMTKDNLFYMITNIISNNMGKLESQLNIFFEFIKPELFYRSKYKYIGKMIFNYILPYKFEKKSDAPISCAYMVQGTQELVEKFITLANEKVKVFILTYDKELKINEINVYTYYKPNSTWAEGRNHLLRAALAIAPEADYFIFLDDDVMLKKYEFKKLEVYLSKFRPYILIPLMDPFMLHSYSYKILNDERYTYIDSQFQVFHRSIINEEICLPYIDKFDKIHWHIGIALHIICLLLFYGRYGQQINWLHCKNEIHRGLDQSDPLSMYSMKNPLVIYKVTPVFIDAVISKVKLSWIQKIICKIIICGTRIRYRPISKMLIFLYKLLPIKKVSTFNYCLPEAERKLFAEAITYGLQQVENTIKNLKLEE